MIHVWGKLLWHVLQNDNLTLRNGTCLMSHGFLCERTWARSWEISKWLPFRGTLEARDLSPLPLAAEAPLCFSQQVEMQLWAPPRSRASQPCGSTCSPHLHRSQAATSRSSCVPFERRGVREWGFCCLPRSLSPACRKEESSRFLCTRACKPSEEPLLSWLSIPLQRDSLVPRVTPRAASPRGCDPKKLLRARVSTNSYSRVQARIQSLAVSVAALQLACVLPPQRSTMACCDKSPWKLFEKPWKKWRGCRLPFVGVVPPLLPSLSLPPRTVACFCAYQENPRWSVGVWGKP